MTVTTNTLELTDVSLSGLRHVRASIADACAACGRAASAVQLVAASKTVPADRLEHYIAAGHAVFGENRVQEARLKWPPLLERYRELELHLIGPLQSNKARDAVATFSVIHSIDRRSLCEAIARACEKQGSQPKLLVQINTGAEPQKAGVMPEDADAFLRACHAEFGLKLAGLMCIPPASEDPAPHFSLLAEIAVRHGLEELSMGMSTDFAQAIAHGATYIRVGSAIFGARPNTRSEVS